MQEPDCFGHGVIYVQEGESRCSQQPGFSSGLDLSRKRVPQVRIQTHECVCVRVFPFACYSPFILEDVRGRVYLKLALNLFC